MSAELTSHRPFEHTYVRPPECNRVVVTGANALKAERKAPVVDRSHPDYLSREVTLAYWKDDLTTQEAVDAKAEELLEKHSHAVRVYVDADGNEMEYPATDPLLPGFQGLN